MLKQMIRQHFVAKRDAAYDRELEEKIDSYGNWYRYHKQELDRRMAAENHVEGDAYSVEVVRYSHLRSYILSGRQMPDIIIACDDDGNLTEHAETMIRDFFAKNKDINLVYGDEDRLDEQGKLVDPWLKSDWAPDTFLSTFYFGNIFAFRSTELYMINPAVRTASDIEAKATLEDEREEEEEAARSDLDDSIRSWIYGQLCLKICQADGGFTRRSSGRFPIGHISEILFHATEKPTPWDSDLIKGSLTGRYSSESASTRLISIIIPSKDNPNVLLTCIKSIEKYTGSSPYEIIVVDNGSSPENQELVKGMLKKHIKNIENSGTEYVYEPMEFNFSKMCNLGAQHANGELLLFLNDDIEIAKPSWLSYLSEKAKLPYVGAVGMKLLYPNSDIIQHAGVVDVHVGPIHKLQFCSNKEEHYFGFNKGVRNVSAVTGACLMVRSKVFEEVGGFDEAKFAVSFNDIDLCLKIFEKGYYNVVRNNMYLYHHESLSRGDDRKDKIKSQRLSMEQENLLNAHPEAYARDPYYHEYLVQDPAVTEFRIALEDVLLRDPHYVTPVQLSSAIPEKWNDPVLHLGVEFANTLDRWLAGPLALYRRRNGNSRDGYYLKGYSFVLDADNAVYERKLLLAPVAEDAEEEEFDPKGTSEAFVHVPHAIGPIWQLDTENVYRGDIADNLTGQKNDKLTGFSAVIKGDALPAGTYTVGMLAIDKTSRQRLVNWSDVKLRIVDGKNGQ